MKKYFYLVLLSVLAVSLFGCGVKTNPFNQSANINPFSQDMSEKLARETGENLAEKMIEGESGIDVEISTDELESVEWPASVPSEVPEFKYGKIELTFDDKNSDDSNVGIMIQISDVEDDGFEKYLTNLGDAGFTIDEEFTIAEDVSNRVFVKDDIRVNITNNPVGENTLWLLIEQIPAEE